MKNLRLASLLALLLFSFAPRFVSRLEAQTLTIVTDTTNPIITDIYESGGGSWIDVNRDGYLDLFVAHGNLSNQNNSLYLNDRKGGYIKVTTGAIVTDGGSSIGSTWGDYNNDGKLDCFVTNRANFGNFLYLGNGDSTFTKVTAGSIVTDRANSNSSSWIDLDGDGVLDLYVVNFQGNDYFYHNNGAPNFDFTRIDSVSPVGDGGNFSIPGAWADLNNDRRPDLFVGNAGSQNDMIYTNYGNFQFAHVVIADGKSTLGASWGDYDNDGNPDLVVANYSNNGNLLYHNSGSPDYSLDPVAGSAIAANAGNCVGSSWGDYDNDGYLDLFIGNDGGASFLYHNDGPPNYTFTRITTGDPVTRVGNSFGCVWVDYDDDGFLDLFVANRLNQHNFLYHNSGNLNHWIEFNLTGTATNRAAIGAKVRIKATINGSSFWQLREVPAQTGYNSQNLTLHFGLGDAVIVDSVKVEWPSGTDDLFEGIPGNSHYYIAEHDSTPPVLIAPAHNEFKSPLAPVRFAWSSKYYGAPFWLQVSGDSTFGTGLVLNDSTISDTSDTVSPGASGRLYWRVRSKRSIHRTLWSEVSTFILDTAISVRRAVTAGWNLLSLPGVPSDNFLRYLFPGAQGRAFKYVNGYQPVDSLTPGLGYWTNFNSPESIHITCVPAVRETIVVSKRWNLIGPVSDPLPVGAVTVINSTMQSPFFGYDSGYFVADTLMPSRGYWVRVSDDGKLVLPAPSENTFAGTQKISSSSLNKFNILSIEDAGGNKRTLYFGSVSALGVDPDQYALPPVPPPGILDARFDDNRMVEAGEVGKSKKVGLILSSARFPATISWEMHEESSGSALRVGGETYGLAGRGKAEVASQEAIIELILAGSRPVPREFQLSQNYPNPFNPVTTIRYQLPVRSTVSLRIVNVLGLVVETLIHDIQEAGYRETEWNASNVASGVYFYELRAARVNDPYKSFVLTKKMQLLK